MAIVNFKNLFTSGFERTRKSITTTALTLLLTFATVAAASAAEIKVFSTIGLRAILQELGPQFEKATRHKLTQPSMLQLH